MRNSAALISLLALVVIAAGCQSGGTSSGPSITDAFIGGTSAIKLSYIPNSPPSEVTDMEKNADGTSNQNSGFPFKATVTVENVGETTIESGDLNVKMSGFFPGDFSVSDNTKLASPNEVQFKGVSKDPEGNRIRGDLLQVEFPTTGDFKYGSVLAGNQQFPFRAEACYKYQTKVLSQVCLLDDFTKNNPTVCKPSGSKPVSNSAAPVHITSVTQSVGGKNKLILNFEVKKVGTSDLFKSDVNSKCTDNYQYKDRIGIQVKTGLTELSCLGLLSPSKVGNDVSGEVLLSNGAATFTCVQVFTGNVDSVKTFDVELDYYARDSITTNVLVKHLI